MVKDGTDGGGARVGAGWKHKALADKVEQGIKADILQLPYPADIEVVDVLPVKEYLNAFHKSSIAIIMGLDRAFWCGNVISESIYGTRELFVF